MCSLLVAVVATSVNHKIYQAIDVGQVFDRSWGLLHFYAETCNHTDVKENIGTDQLLAYVDEGYLYFKDLCEPGNRTEFTGLEMICENEFSCALCKYVACPLDGGSTTFFYQEPNKKHNWKWSIYSWVLKDPNCWLQPRVYFMRNLLTIFFANCSENMIVLQFIAMALIARPKAKHNYFADAMYLGYVLIAHVCLIFESSVAPFDGELNFREQYFVVSVCSFSAYIFFYFIARRCRVYLKLYNTTQINTHFRRCLQVIASSLAPTLFLYLGSLGCSKLDISQKDTYTCTALAQVNFAVVCNISIGAAFFVLFNFTFQNVKFVDIMTVSEKIKSIDLILRFVVVSLLQTVGMAIFGFRPFDPRSSEEYVGDTVLKLAKFGGLSLVLIWNGESVGVAKN